MERKTVYNIGLRQPQGGLTGGISIAGDKISDIRRPAVFYHCHHWIGILCPLISDVDQA